MTPDTAWSSLAATAIVALASGARLMSEVIGVSTPSTRILTVSMLLSVTPRVESCKVAPAVCVLKAAVEPAAASWLSMKALSVARSARIAAVRPDEASSITTVSRPEPPSILLTPVPPASSSLPVPPYSVSLPAPPENTSLPASPYITSSPFSPYIVSSLPPPKKPSLPSPPYNVSLPASPVRVSAPRPPRMTSLPAPPLMRSLPAPPSITSSAVVPVMTSLPAVPLIIAIANCALIQVSIQSFWIGV